MEMPPKAMRIWSRAAEKARRGRDATRVAALALFRKDRLCMVKLRLRCESKSDRSLEKGPAGGWRLPKTSVGVTSVEQVRVAEAVVDASVRSVAELRVRRRDGVVAGESAAGRKREQIEVLQTDAVKAGRRGVKVGRGIDSQDGSRIVREISDVLAFKECGYSGCYGVEVTDDAKSFVVAEKEGAVLDDGAANAAAELILMPAGLGDDGSEL